MNNLTFSHKNGDPSQNGQGRGNSIFAKYFPRIERWRREKVLINDLLEEAREMVAKSDEWEKRGHWLMAGRYKENAAGQIDKLIDIKISSELIIRRSSLLKDAMVLYAVEMGHAGRYDPAVEFRMYMVAKRMGEGKIARSHLDAAMKGFDQMYQNKNLENLVRLNRLKRQFLTELWEGETEDAIRLAVEAETVAKGIRNPEGTTDRAKDTKQWMDAQIAERFKDQNEAER